MLNSSLALDNSLSLPEAASLDLSPSTPVVNLAPRNILFVIEGTTKRPNGFSKENFSVSYATVEEASFLLNSGTRNLFTPDVILISSDLENYTDKYLNKVKDLAQEWSIPFILYSTKFDSISRNIAAEFGFDDYYSGNLSQTFFKKAEFIKKLKEYKNKRGDKPYHVNPHHEAMTQVKMWALKRAFDILVSGTLLLLLSPLMLLIALIIKLESKGSVFYVAKRAGNGYQIFNFYKFRSMRQGADSELKKLSHMNQYGDAVFFKIQNDPRITRFGSFLRNTSLDEIPQLINVLKGDMSLVGNRPLPLYEAEKLTKDQIAWRFLAPAGITGLWQVTKRGKSNMSEDERIQLDMEYAMNNSFLYDIRILLNTLPALLQKAEV